jgi:hypothetical protein
MQDPQVIQILEIVAPSVIAVTFIIAAAAVADSWFGKRAKRLPPVDAAAQARIEERLNHLTNAVDAIAVEVERISEGQRFTTKLLADSSINSEAPPVIGRDATLPSAARTS